VSYIVATTDLLTTAAEDLAGIGSAVNAATAAAASPTTSVLAAGADEVSTRIATLFGAQAVEFQALTAQAAQLHDRFVLTLAADADAYLTTEIANVNLAGASATGSAAAGTRITVPGAGPLYYPNFLTQFPYLGQYLLQGGVSGPSSVSILQGYDLLNHAIGQNWFPGSTPQVVNYPASIGIISASLAAPGVNDAVAMGQRALNDQIMNAFANGNGSPVHIAGLSEGTIVLNRELAYLAANPTAPPAHALQFVLFSSPELGLAHIYIPNGLTVPVIDYTAHGLSNTQYDVSVVYGQYDFFGNPPDRPWNLPAVVNSLFGAAYYHDPAALASPSDAVVVSSATTSLGGTITTYMIPSPTLPMLLPLEQIGVPQPIVANLNSVLQPIVNDGYSSLTPDAGPYFSQGALVGVPTAADVVSLLEDGLLGAQ
jgi:PE-PPE domain-containing protein/PE family protein